MKALKVLVADDSLICRIQLRQILEREGDIRVVAEATDGSTVVELVQTHRPDLLVVDLQMPGVDGLHTIERVMAKDPVPILVVTGRPGASSQDVVFEAIRRGALDLAEKPAPADWKAQARLRATARQLASVPVVRHVGARDRRPSTPSALRPIEVVAAGQLRVPLIGVGASAGGPPALVAFLKNIPPVFSGCFAVVQHLPPGFVAAFADFLSRRIRLPVRVATEGAEITAGCVFLAPDGCHLVARDRGRFGLLDAPPVEGHLPAASVLLSSMADVFGGHGIGVVLSGIGRDGVSGLREMRHRGALTLAQSAATCAVYGMPRAAIESGAALRSETPEDLCTIVIDAVRSGHRRGVLPAR